MSTKVKRTKEGYEVSQFVGTSRAKRIWREPVLIPYGDDAALQAELLKQIEVSRNMALPGGIK